MARQVKVVLVGDGSVGKSSLVARFVREGFVQRYAQTVGVDFYEKRIQVRGEVFADLQIWDIGGQSIRSKMLPRYLSGAQVVFVVYDLSNRDSLLDADDWLAQLNAVYPAKKKKEPPDVYAVGNKADLIHCRQVSDKDHDLFWRSRGLKGGFVTSAASGENVSRAVYKAAASAVGINLTATELEFQDRVLAVHHPPPHEDGGRTRDADAIEAEDRILERRKKLREARGTKPCRCRIA